MSRMILTSSYLITVLTALFNNCRVCFQCVNAAPCLVVIGVVPPFCHLLPIESDTIPEVNPYAGRWHDIDVIAVLVRVVVLRGS